MLKKCLTFLVLSVSTVAAYGRPVAYTDLLRYVQAAPDQGETNTCWFVASTGAMEILLNKKDKIKNPKLNGKNDLSESFLIYQNDFYDEATRYQSFLETIVLRFNYGVAIQNIVWPFMAYNADGTDSQQAWWKHPEFNTLPRIEVPQVKTQVLFTRGKRWATKVLRPEDVELIKETLYQRKSPIIINYNDDGYWHVVLIVGYDDRKQGSCYQIEKEECNKRGTFYVRDSDGRKIEARATNWFLLKANTAAVVELK